MSAQVNGQTRLELREGGNLVQVFVPQQETDRLRAERDAYEQTVRHLLQQRIPPLTEAEVAEMRAGTVTIDQLLADAEEIIRGAS